MNWLKIRKYNLESYFSFVWPTINGHTCQFTSICSSGSAVSFPLCYSLMILADRGVGVMFSGKSSAKPFLRFSLIGIFGNFSSWWSSCIQSSPTDNVRLDPKKSFLRLQKSYSYSLDFRLNWNAAEEWCKPTASLKNVCTSMDAPTSSALCLSSVFGLSPLLSCLNDCLNSCSSSSAVILST